ncbi:MAG: hypothetical protein IPN82_09930 [Chitinophagaceae bacterium]|nr:hypothetical protein [Chitinophagaceae bacterium]MBP6476527.1 hypothetical protein [Chitinophagaceae bacterium]MBP7107430.1 hypothetical protein [Chitinophagaceae bacterium]MBP7314444.1 hypothetical protein [Chitinophagaceae bacterium]HQV54737.1 hypothetical protein [Chitinophagaceae bacterium]
MKKIIGFTMLAFSLTAIMYSCQPDSKKEVIVVPAAPTPTPSTIIIEKAPAKKETTITLDKNGVKVEGKKVDISIKKQ